MSIFTLVFYVAIVAVVLTLLNIFALKNSKNYVMSFLQNFCGTLFIVSGYVKAVDPLGTAFKMEDYFAEFMYTFQDTAVSFIAPMFPWLAEHSIVVSILMIVFEIALGVMLIIGSKPKLTAWLFFLLVVFFTILTGYTYLTGYVPSGVNFFEFGKWGDWVSTNMKVTDCGCFGDFIKLKPKNSFFKDVFLLFPSIYFVIRHTDMHQTFKPLLRNGIVWVATIGFTVFCFYNFAWDEPVVDFRPFAAGNDIRTLKAEEAEKSDIANQVTGYSMTNKSTGENVTLEIADYMKRYKEFPKEEWDLVQVKGNPPFEPSKISDFNISGTEGENVTESILGDPNFSFMVLTYELKTLDEKKMSTSTVTDTIFNIDTILVDGMDEPQLVKSIKEVVSREVQNEVAVFDAGFVSKFTEGINPVVDKAQEVGYKVFAVTSPNDPAVIDDFRHATQSAYPFYTADDLLLKTIQRSNPGLVLWKDGKIVQKWHINKLPAFEEIQAKYLK